MIGTYFGGGERQKIDLKIRIDMQRKELKITRKSNGLFGVYNFAHLYSNGVKLGFSCSDSGDFCEVF